MFDFTGKVLALTGANGGISQAIASLFYGYGASLVLSDVNGEGLDQFAVDLDPSGTRVATIAHDVSKSEDADAMASLAEERFGGVDFLVTGAGLYLAQLVESMTDDQWRQSMAINLDGVFYTCRAMIPKLRDGGAIVNIASMAGHRGSFQHAHYAAAKGGVLVFSRSLMHELAPRGIRVNCISPGLIETPLIQPLLRSQGEALLRATPLKRFGKPEEVAGVVAFLCSRAAGFVNGETIHVNGGLYVVG